MMKGASPVRSDFGPQQYQNSAKQALPVKVFSIPGLSNSNGKKISMTNA